MKTVLNTNEVDAMAQPLFFGEPLGIQRYDRFKYPIFFELFKKQKEFDWWPHEINLQKDRNDYKILSEAERFVFDSNLKFQTLGDSMLSRSISSLREFVTNSELEICMNKWSQMEDIHSYSYSYLLLNMHPNATEFFDSIIPDKEIVSRANLIRSNYDRILGAEGSEKDVKERILNCIIATNVMEGLVFYVSFACSFYFGYRGKMEGNAKIIKMIQRDEAQHFSVTQNLLKILGEREDEGFADLVAASQQKIQDMYVESVEGQKDWCKYLFSKGSLLGLNEEVLGGYGEWLADNRLRSLGLKKAFNRKDNPLAGWLDSYLDSSKVQVAPQETEISAYKLAARNTNIAHNAFDDIEL